MQSPFFSTIVVTHDSERFIGPCLEALSVEADGVEIIVIDNGSRDKTRQIIRAFSGGRVRLVANNSNCGPCTGRNQGIELSGGEWVVTVDCDCVVGQDFFRRLAGKIADLSPEVGILQPKIYNRDRRTLYAAGIRLTAFRRFSEIGRNQPDGDRFAASRPVFGACSAAAVYRRSMLSELRDRYGYFDERFFFLVEDVDLSWRAQKRGWRALYVPEAVCYHEGNSSLVSEKIRQYLSYRNRAYMIAKNQGRLSYLARILPSLCYDLPRFACLVAFNPYVFNLERLEADLVRTPPRQ